jgi:hypothetical protein
VPRRSSTKCSRLVTKAGYVDITIPVGPLTGAATADVRLTRQRVGVFGRITESAPTDTAPIPSARVRVANGRAAGTVAVADRDGAFWLSTLSERADVIVEADGFSDTRVTFDPATDAAGRAIRLAPREVQIEHGVFELHVPEVLQHVFLRCRTTRRPERASGDERVSLTGRRQFSI